MPLLQTYEEARLLWEAKGWGITKVAAVLMKNPKLGDFDVSQASLSRKTSKGHRVPIEPEVAIAVEDLETQNWFQGRTEIVIAGLRALHGRCPEVDARELAMALLAHLPTHELALKLADAILAHAGLSSGAGSLLDRVAWGIADRLRETKLAQQLAQHLDHLGAKRLALVAGVASVVAVTAAGGVWLVLGAVSERGQQASAPSPTINIYTNVGSAPVVFDTRLWLGALSEMGEKPPPEQLIPDKPLPGQKVPPCLEAAAEEPIGGGCWTQIARRPPCGLLFRYRDACYRPIAADPQKPVGIKTEVHGQEPR